MTSFDQPPRLEGDTSEVITSAIYHLERQGTLLGIGRMLLPELVGRNEWLADGGHIDFDRAYDVRVTGVSGNERDGGDVWVIQDQTLVDVPGSDIEIPKLNAQNNPDDQLETYRYLAQQVEHLLGRSSLTIVLS